MELDQLQHAPLAGGGPELEATSALSPCPASRTHYLLDFRLLDAKDATSLEYKLDSFSYVYRKLTGKDVTFEFPVVAAE